MSRIADEDAHRIVETYRAFCRKAMDGTDCSLSTAELKAVGAFVCGECLDRAFANQDVDGQERAAIQEEIFALLQRECPEMALDSPLEFDGRVFKKKR